MAGGRGRVEGLCWLKPKGLAVGDPSGRGGGLAAVKRAHPERSALRPGLQDSPAWRGPWPPEGHGHAGGDFPGGGGGGPGNNAGL